ncbi:MAG: PhoX family phosphatase [Pseudomonadales bacterium]
MDFDNGSSNDSGNRPFQEVLRARASRRSVLSGGLAAAATGFLMPVTAVADDGDDDRWGERRPYRRRRRGLINFEPVTVADGSGPSPAVSPDYDYQVLIPWGDPLEPDGPSYEGDPNTRPSANDQASMIGIGHDGMWFFPYRRSGRESNRAGMLCINHEFGINTHVIGKEMPESIEDVRLSQHAHGVSVVAIANWKGQWQQISSRNSRRIHVNTPMQFSGPAAGSELIQTPNGNVPLGTVNNCSSGYTPWGTYVTCEENFNGYFGASNLTGTWTATPEQERYGFSDDGFGYGWHNFDRRFDLSDSDYRNEENRFGWVVEIDPWDATRTPVKRTALGRFKHEGAEVTIGRGGRAVVYMGDDERFDYIYKFVSADDWKYLREQGISPLDEGTLYVARFNDDNTGEWLPLTMDNPDLAARFSSQAELLTYTRIAADIVGATPMDRPEWTSVAPDGYVYCTLTNNSRRDGTGPKIINGREVDSGADAANPLAPNPDGHIIRWKDSEYFTGTDFVWDIFLISETTHGTEDTFSDPDGIWADPDGRLFIETDGGQKDGLNNQMLIANTTTGELRRLLTGVTDCEITGLTVTPDRRTMFCNVQHPGDGDPSATNFPAATDGVTIPRDATLVVWRKDGGIVGS